MAEQVNQRIEQMINELEQMRRTSLYNDDEIKEISRKRKEFEYRIQRHVKQKEDYVQYITYEITLLEDITNRRKAANMTEKKKDIEYAIAKRLNKVFKQFIYRFQNEVDVYFEYLKFCKSVGFNSAASGIIGQMLQMHGDKPKMWLLASKWEKEEQNNLQASRAFLLKGLQRHVADEELYMELFKSELLVLAFSSENEEDKEKLLKRADVVWKNGLKNLDQVGFLFHCLDLVLKYDVEGDMRDCIKEEIWARKDKSEVWPYVADKELEGCHWKEIEEFVEKNDKLPEVVYNCIGVYEKALTQFPDDKLCTKYIRTVLGLDGICNESQKISAVKQAWWLGYKRDVLTNDMFAFGIEMLKAEGETSDEEMWELLNNVTEKHSKHRCVWEEKLLLSKSDEQKTMLILNEAIKVLKAEDAIHLYNIMVDNVESNDTLKDLLMRLRNCENNIILSIKPRLLQKTYDHNGLRAARELYDELIRTLPMQLELNEVMIDIECLQPVQNVELIRKCYECSIVHYGKENVDVWSDYIEFESVTGDPVYAPAIYRRALGMLSSEKIIEFIKKQTMHRAN